MFKEFTKGLFRKNPIFVVMVGLCPTLATSVSVESGFWMGLAATMVLVASNIIISMIRNYIPGGVRIPCFIVVIASFVTMVEMLMKGFLAPELNRTLGIFIPLIVVNCIILYRAEDFASKNGVFASALDGLGMGAGFMLALLLLATIRESIGAGTLWGYALVPGYKPITIMVLAPGAFILIGLLMGYFRLSRETQHTILLWIFFFPVMALLAIAKSLRARGPEAPVPAPAGLPPAALAEGGGAHG